MTGETARIRIACGACGTVTLAPAGIIAQRCPHCGSTDIVCTEAATDVPFAPDGVVPFAFDAPTARRRALRWVRRAWFPPSKLAALAQSDALVRRYLPFWMFSTHATAYWAGSGATRGIIEMDFRSVLVCADRDADARWPSLLEPVMPGDVRDFDAAYISGIDVVEGRRGLDEALSLAHARIERELAAAARHGRRNREREKLQLSRIEHARETYRRVLLPVWLLEYRYCGRGYHVIVDGARGRVAGEAPQSIAKVALLVVASLWMILFVEDAETAMSIPVAIVEGVRWLVRRPLSG